MWPNIIAKAYVLLLAVAFCDHTTQAMVQDTIPAAEAPDLAEGLPQQKPQHEQPREPPPLGEDKPPAFEQTGAPDHKQPQGSTASSSAAATADNNKRSTVWAWVARDEVARPWAEGWFPVLGECHVQANGSQRRTVEAATQTLQSEPIVLHGLSLLDQGEKYQNWAEEISSYISGGSTEGIQVWDEDYRRYAHYKFATRYLYHKVHGIRTQRQQQGQEYDEAAEIDKILKDQKIQDEILQQATNALHEAAKSRNAGVERMLVLLNRHPKYTSEAEKAAAERAKEARLKKAQAAGGLADVEDDQEEGEDSSSATSGEYQFMRKAREAYKKAKQNGSSVGVEILRGNKKHDEPQGSTPAQDRPASKPRAEKEESDDDNDDEDREEDDRSTAASKNSDGKRTKGKGFTRQPRGKGKETKGDTKGEQERRGRSLVTLLRHGGNDGHFVEKLVPFKVVDGVERWAKMQDLSEDMHLRWANILRVVFNPSDGVQRLCAYHTEKEIWIGAYKSDYIGKGQGKRMRGSTPAAFRFHDGKQTSINEQEMLALLLARAEGQQQPPPQKSVSKQHEGGLAGTQQQHQEPGSRASQQQHAAAAAAAGKETDEGSHMGEMEGKDKNAASTQAAAHSKDLGKEAPRTPKKDVSPQFKPASKKSDRASRHHERSTKRSKVKKSTRSRKRKKAGKNKAKEERRSKGKHAKKSKKRKVPSTSSSSSSTSSPSPASESSGHEDSGGQKPASSAKMARKALPDGMVQH